MIGYTGDGDKSSWIKTELGFDWAFNYKTQDVKQTLKIAAPKGVDVFIDSVGGIFHAAVMEHMAMNGRVCLLGNLASYNNPKNVPMVPANDMAIALKVYMHMYTSEYLAVYISGAGIAGITRRAASGRNSRNSYSRNKHL